MENKIILSAKNIRKEFVAKKHFITGKIEEKLVAVKNVSLDVQEGKTLGIVGESGSGKTTTGEILGGLQQPSYGGVYFYDENINDLSDDSYNEYRKNVQFIFQDPKGSMDPNYTIEDNVAFPLLTLKIVNTKKEARLLAASMLEKVGLDSSIKNKLPSEISGGQCQRAAIARALVVSPKIIICDEPVSALDVSIQAQILNLLKRLQKEIGISYIFISHDIGVVNYMSDTIIVMNNGNVVETGAAKEVFLHPKNSYTKKLLESAFYS